MIESFKSGLLSSTGASVGSPRLSRANSPLSLTDPPTSPHLRFSRKKNGTLGQGGEPLSIMIASPGDENERSVALRREGGRSYYFFWGGGQEDNTERPHTMGERHTHRP
jgi:hypothetical protein